MRRCGVLCLAAWCMSVAAMGQTTGAPAPTPIAELLAEAERLVAEEKYAEAEPFVNAALAQESSNVQALSLSGEVYEMLGQAARAREAYNAVRAIQPNEFRANFGLGRLYVGTNMPRQALHYLDIAEPVAPAEKKAELLLLKGRALRSSGQTAKAIETIENAIRADEKHFLAWQYLAVILTESQDYDRALVATQRLVQIAEFEMQQDRSNLEAIGRLNAAYDSRLSVLREYHQRLYVPNVDGTRSDVLQPGTEKAAAAMLQAVVETLVLQAELHRMMSYHQAIPVAEKMVEYDAATPGHWMQLALLYVNTAQDAKAAAALEKVLELDPQNMDARQQLERLPPEARQSDAAAAARTPAAP